MIYFSTGHQCFHAVSTHCLLLFCLGSVVHLGVIMVYIQHPTHIQSGVLKSHSTPQVPSALSHPDLSFSLSLCFCLCAFHFHSSSSSPAGVVILKAVCLFHFSFPIYFLFPLCLQHFSFYSPPFQREKSSTPGMKPGTPMSQESNTPGPSGPPQFRPVPGKPGVDPLGKIFS